MKLSEERERRFAAFRQWLSRNTALTERPRGDAVARAKRVERALREMLGGIDLDAEYARDRLDNVLRTLEYTAEDVHNHREPPAGITFDFSDGEPRYYERIQSILNDLKKAVKQYRDFCDETL